MLENIVEIIKEVCLKYKLVKDFHYQSSILTNAQNNHNYLQCVLDDVSIHNLNITPRPNIFVSQFDLYILGFPTKEEESILEIQSICYDAAIRIINKLDDIGIKDYQGMLAVHDYSILTLSHYTDDSTCGVKVSISLEVPINVCDLEDYFDDEVTEKPEDTVEEKKIELKPIRIKNEQQC